MGSAIRSSTGIVSLVMLGTALLLMLFVILSSITTRTPFDKSYFLTADTSGVTGARPTSQWNYLRTCGAGNTDCGAWVPGMVVGAPWVGGGKGAPSKLVGKHYKGTTSDFYFYAWRFGWTFYLMGAFTTALGFLTALASPFSRLAAGISSFLIMNALLWFSLGAALMTVTFVKVRNAFRAEGMSAALGKYAFGFTWGAWFALVIAGILLFLGCVGGRSKDTSRDTLNRSNSSSGNRGFFRRQRSRKSTRGSFVDAESQRRVKDEYN